MHSNQEEELKMKVGDAYIKAWQNVDLDTWKSNRICFTTHTLFTHIEILVMQLLSVCLYLYQIFIST